MTDFKKIMQINRFPQRWMANFLRRRGWIVMWLEPDARKCRTLCWMREYLRQEGIEVPR